MKNTIAALIFILFLGTNSFSQSKMQSWKELKDFHTVMSQTFHPSEEGNLEPIKSRATEMKEKAFILADSKIPAEFDNKKVKDAVNKLKKGTIKMEKIVANKSSDKEITNHLIALHDTFHEIVGLCSKESEHGDTKNEK